MASPVQLPPIATDTTEGTVARWLVQPGDEVEEGQVIAEVDTAKVLFEVEAPVAGTVLELRAAVGEDVTVGDTLAWIGAAGERPPAQPASGRGGELRAAPPVRRLAERLGVALGDLAGSGAGGRILKVDVERAAAAGGGQAPTDAAGRMRAAIAAAMTRSKREVPHFYVDLEVDTTAREDDVAAHGFTAVLLDAVARTLAADPALNATYEEGRGLVRGDGVHLGVAVGLDDGLVVPVLRDADRLGPAGLASELAAAVEKARARRLTAADTAGATFTVSNVGMTGVDGIVPIVHRPAVAILGAGARTLRPRIVDGAVAARATVRLVLACDHRAVDGLRASSWLAGLGRTLAGTEER